MNVTSMILGITMLSTAFALQILEPKPASDVSHLMLEQAVPRSFGDWKEVQQQTALIDPGKSATDEPNMDRPYDDVLMRAYENSHGEVVLLALAYGRNQRQEVKIHRPDVCYTAQGFELVSRSPVAFPVAGSHGRPIRGMRMLVSAPGRTEAVSYWIRIGDMYTDNAWAIRYHIFQQGVSGKAVDGVLVRVSQIVSDSSAASTERYQLQELFLADLVRALPVDVRRVLIG